MFVKHCHQQLGSKFFIVVESNKSHVRTVCNCTQFSYGDTITYHNLYTYIITQGYICTDKVYYYSRCVVHVSRCQHMPLLVTLYCTEYADPYSSIFSYS